MPYGGGTNVSGALSLPPGEGRPIASVDMGRMNRILWLDEENLQACVEAGITGKELERLLGERGYTSGHDPDSVELSTLGGWIATNASGMKKNRYGNIEDIVVEATLVTPAGEVESRRATPRNSTGVAPRLWLFGCEGNLGLITKAVIKIHPRPEAREYGSLVFPSLDHGVRYLKALRREGALPASIRLVNNTEFRFGQALKPAPSAMTRVKTAIQRFVLVRLKGFDLRSLAACTVVMEGTRRELAWQRRIIFSLARRFGGVSAGAHNGRRGYMLTFAIAYIRDFLNQFHVMGETFETSVPWDRIHDVTGAVERELADQCRAHGVRGTPYLSYRVTQTYHTGVCIYFTMGFQRQGPGGARPGLPRRGGAAAAGDPRPRRLPLPPPRRRQDPRRLPAGDPDRGQPEGHAGDETGDGPGRRLRHRQRRPGRRPLSPPGAPGTLRRHHRRLLGPGSGPGRGLRPRRRPSHPHGPAGGAAGRGRRGVRSPRWRRWRATSPSPETARGSWRPRWPLTAASTASSPTPG